VAPLFATIKPGQITMRYFYPPTVLLRTDLSGCPMRGRTLFRCVLVLILCAAVGLLVHGCSSTAAPLSIQMYNPETKQTLTCAARDVTARADTAVLTRAVESCARELESRGFVRAK
jgi:hypothetical protein